MAFSPAGLGWMGRGKGIRRALSRPIGTGGSYYSGSGVGASLVASFPVLVSFNGPSGRMGAENPNSLGFGFSGAPVSNLTVALASGYTAPWLTITIAGNGQGFTLSGIPPASAIGSSVVLNVNAVFGPAGQTSGFSAGLIIYPVLNPDFTPPPTTGIDGAVHLTSTVGQALNFDFPYNAAVFQATFTPSDPSVVVNTGAMPGGGSGMHIGGTPLAGNYIVTVDVRDSSFVLLKHYIFQITVS
jgi:hypothetical protein